ncbi:hypothetical protein OAS39_06230 [Pirellulales bacterium]|nr:hypothetical protein [Pirellulales bacterium]
MQFVSLAKRQTEIVDGDLLLFRGSGLLSRCIQIAGRSTYSHAARAAWWGDDLFCCELRGWSGGRAVTLASQVRRYAGQIDVFAANPANRWPAYDRDGAVHYMRRLAGSDYGFASVFRAALLHLPGLRLLARPELDDSAATFVPPFCSQACAMADRIGGGVDPVPHLADRLTEPADLARSNFYQYRFTLIP